MHAFLTSELTSLQESFSAEDFVERLAWKASSGNLSAKADNEDFNPQIIHDAFTSAIR